MPNYLALFSYAPDAMAAMIENPADRETAVRAGFPPLASYRDGTAFRSFVETESAKYGRMIKAEGMTLE